MKKALFIVMALGLMQFSATAQTPGHEHHMHHMPPVHHMHHIPLPVHHHHGMDMHHHMPPVHHEMAGHHSHGGNMKAGHANTGHAASHAAVGTGKAHTGTGKGSMHKAGSGAKPAAH